jgi:hypothetical protein
MYYPGGAWRRRRHEADHMDVRTLGKSLCIALALTVAACAQRPPPETPLDMTAVKADLENVARARVLFAHQSVGRNVLDGVQALADEAHVPVRIVEIEGAPPDDLPGIFHAYVGSNGDGDSKIAAFTELLGRSSYDAALLKFCYEDLQTSAKGTDGLDDRYLSGIARLHSTLPDVRVIPVTSPLRADPPGWKLSIKRGIGWDVPDDTDNERRNAFNESLRKRVGGSPLFDIATVESTLPDSSRSSFTAGSRTVYTLARGYTVDGGHLNALGARRAAAEFVHVLSRALSQPSKAP